MIKLGRLHCASGKIAAQNRNRVGFLQGIFLYEPVTNSEKKEKHSDDGEERQCAQDCQKALKMLCDDSCLSRGLHLSELSSAIALSHWSLGLEHFMGQTLPQGNGAIDAPVQKHPENQALRTAFGGWCSE
jgi:hypothetical protein